MPAIEDVTITILLRNLKMNRAHPLAAKSIAMPEKLAANNCSLDEAAERPVYCVDSAPEWRCQCTTQDAWCLCIQNCSCVKQAPSKVATFMAARTIYFVISTDDASSLLSLSLDAVQYDGNQDRQIAANLHWLRLRALDSYSL